LATLRRFIVSHARQAREVLLLGVTPEIATMPWPQDTSLTAADRSPEMIKKLWPGDAPGLRRVLCVDWFELPRPPRRYDLVLADGSFNVVGYPSDLRRLLAGVAGLVAHGALLLTRTFTRPLQAERMVDLEDAARAGEAGSFHAFKFRLAMAQQQTAELGVSMDDIWRLWRGLDDRIDGLSALNGWTPEVVSTIDRFRGSHMRLSFPTRDELVVTLRTAGLSLVDSHTPAYEMGERCPTQAWRF
jgi:SAM-dependent methyltransferase